LPAEPERGLTPRDEAAHLSDGGDASVSSFQQVAESRVAFVWFERMGHTDRGAPEERVHGFAP
jgi:hypothetical protein